MNERGQGLAEYALILALVVVVAIVALALLGTQMSEFIQSITNILSGTPPGTPAP